MRGIVAAALAMGFAACGLTACVSDQAALPQAAAAGEWKIEKRTDRVSDRPQFSAVLITRSRSASAAQAAPTVPQLASLQLMCFDGAPVVRLHFVHEVGSNRNSRLAYRFDGNPTRSVNARVLQDFRTIMIEDETDVARFADELRSASRLSVQVTSLVRGASSADFKVEGGAVALDAAFSACPLRGAAKQA
jgi:hypothetical protein